MAVTGSLEQIKTKVRKITGRLSVNKLSEDDLENYINDFYQYDFPMEVKHWETTNYLSPILGNDGNLVPDEPYYAVDVNSYSAIAPPFYVGGYEIDYFQNVAEFMNYFPSRKTVVTLDTGSGIAGPYSGTITTTPILTQSIFISAVDNAGNSLTCTANDAGVLSGDVVAGGTIDYETGAVDGLTWTAVIPTGNVISAQYLIYVSGRPTAVLHANQALTFYPVPNIAYETYCKVTQTPDALGAGDQPQVRNWWNMIAYGASLKIFSDNGDFDNYEKYNVLFNKYKRLAQRRTLEQLKTQRVATIYDNQSVPRESFPSNI